MTPYGLAPSPYPQNTIAKPLHCYGSTVSLDPSSLSPEPDSEAVSALLTAIPENIPGDILSLTNALAASSYSPEPKFSSTGKKQQPHVVGRPVLASPAIGAGAAFDEILDSIAAESIAPESIAAESSADGNGYRFDDRSSG
jgi:hypothetical protein